MSRFYKIFLLSSLLSLLFLLTGCLRTEQTKQVIDETKQAVEEIGDLIDDIIQVVDQGEIDELTNDFNEGLLQAETEPPIVTIEIDEETEAQEQKVLEEELIAENPMIKKQYLYLDEDWFYDDLLYTLFEAVANQKQTVTIEAIDSDYFNELCDDLYSIIGKTQYKYDIEGMQWTSDGQQIKINFEYNQEAVEHTKVMIVEAKQIANQLFTDTITDMEKIMAAYKYLQLNTAYDEDAAEQIHDNIYSAAHHGYGALIEGEAVCEGYASALNVLLNLGGIETRLIESPSLNHVWSMVKLNGAWYHCDVTFDDKLPDTKNNADYDYFLKNDQYMIDDDIGRNVSDKPTASQSNYHYDIYSAEHYNINQIEYIYKLVDGVLMRDDVSDNSFDISNGLAIATDVGSWVSSPNDYTIIYVKESTKQLIMVDFDGKNQSVLGTFNENGIVLDVTSLGDAYVLTCATSMNGLTTQINVNK